MIKEIYAKLNLKQKEAVDTTEGPVMVLAGPGTGKTQVLSTRIAKIIETAKARPREILALTFSQSAANSMQQRLISLIKDKAYDIDIKTFHAFCNDIILENRDLFGYSSDSIQIEELEKTKLLKKIIDENDFQFLKPFNAPYLYKSDILKRIGDLKKEGISPAKLEGILEQYKQELESQKEINPRTQRPKVAWQDKYKNYQKLKELGRIYGIYQEKLKSKNYYDFDDMIIWVLAKMEEDEDFLNRYQERYKYILSDEYQDTNFSQSQVIKLLTSNCKNPNIFVVGDEDQSIYRFQGASLGNILFFNQEFPSSKIISIDINYRSLKKIVDLSNYLIKKNQERVDNFLKDLNFNKVAKSFYDEAGNQGKLKILNFKNQEHEKNFLLIKIKELLKQKKDPSEIAVITRTNSEIEAISEFLIQNKIPLDSKNQTSILDKGEIKNLHQLLKSIVNPKYAKGIYQSMSLAVFGIKPRDFFNFTQKAASQRENYLDFYLQQGDNLKGEIKEFSKIRNFFDLIIRLNKLSASAPAIIVFEELLRETKLIEKSIIKKDFILLSLISSFFDFIRNQNKKNPDLQLKDLTKDLD
ncbi:MAG: AAA family ATPase, partial [Candidatus Moranbacteria bacterium]|nr:AAA family ATPase [Candidatus Moranbacteria bacterium]